MHTYRDTITGETFAREHLLTHPKWNIEHVTEEVPSQIYFTREGGGLGDLAMTLGAVQAVRKKYPSTPICYLASFPFRQILEAHPDIDEICEYGSIDLPDNAIVYSLSHPCPAAAYETEHGVQCRKSRIEIFGMACGVEPELPRLYLSEDEKAWGRAWLEQRCQSKFKVGVALHTSERWRDYEETELLLWKLDESEAIDVVALDGEIETDFVDTAGLNIRQAMSICANLDLVISPDTAWVHLAACMNVRVLGLFGSMNPKVRIKPYGNIHQWIVGECPYEIQPCWYSVCGEKDEIQPCLQFSHRRVIETAKAMLEAGADADASPSALPSKLEIGGGQNPTPGYLHLDIDPNAENVDIVGDFRALFAPHDYPIGEHSELSALHGRTFAKVRLIHVIEHVHWLHQPAMWTWLYDILELNGSIQIETPDLNVICREYLFGHDDALARSKHAAFRLHSGGSVRNGFGDHHLGCYDYARLKTEMEEAGFHARLESVDGVIRGVGSKTPILLAEPVKLQTKKPIVLELGSGGKPHADVTVCVDGLNYADKIGDRDFVQHDLTQLPLPFQSACASKIYACHVIEHLTRNQAKALLTDVHRILANDGVLHIQVPNLAKIIEIASTEDDLENPHATAWGSVADAIFSHFASGHDTNPYNQHRYGYSHQTMVKLLNECGFRVVEANDPTTWAVIVQARKESK